MAPNATGTKPAKSWAWAGVTGIALAAGLMFSQWMPSESALPTPRSPGKDSAISGDLEYRQPAWPEGPSSQAMFLRLSLGTIAVLGLCAGSLWAMKRWLALAPTAAAKAGELRLVESLHLGNRCMLHLVALPDRQILVGADPAGIKSMLVVSETFDKLLAETPDATESTESPELTLRRAA